MSASDDQGPFIPKSIVLVGSIRHETDKAIQFSFMNDEDIKQTEWFPISQTNKIVRHTQADMDELHITPWIAKQKGLA